MFRGCSSLHTHFSTTLNTNTSCIWSLCFLFPRWGCWGNDALTNKSITSMNVGMQHIAIKHHLKCNWSPVLCAQRVWNFTYNLCWEWAVSVLFRSMMFVLNVLVLINYIQIHHWRSNWFEGNRGDVVGVTRRTVQIQKVSENRLAQSEIVWDFGVVSLSHLLTKRM